MYDLICMIWYVWFDLYDLICMIWYVWFDLYDLICMIESLKSFDASIQCAAPFVWCNWKTCPLPFFAFQRERERERESQAREHGFLWENINCDYLNGTIAKLVNKHIQYCFLSDRLWWFPFQSICSCSLTRVTLDSIHNSCDV